MMLTGTIDDIKDLLNKEPNSLDVILMIEHLFKEVLGLVANPNEEYLSEVSEKAGELAPLIQEEVSGKIEELTPSMQKKGKIDVSTQLLKLWYAGQLQAIANLCNLSLMREIPFKTKAFLRREHILPALKVLNDEGEHNLNQLSLKLGIQDQAQMSKIVKELSKHKLIEKIKEGRELWIRLTDLGYRSLNLDIITSNEQSKIRRQAITKANWDEDKRYFPEDKDSRKKYEIAFVEDSGILNISLLKEDQVNSPKTLRIAGSSSVLQGFL